MSTHPSQSAPSKPHKSPWRWLIYLGIGVVFLFIGVAIGMTDSGGASTAGAGGASAAEVAEPQGDVDSAVSERAEARAGRAEARAGAGGASDAEVAELQDDVDRAISERDEARAERDEAREEATAAHERAERAEAELQEAQAAADEQEAQAEAEEAEAEESGNSFGDGQWIVGEDIQAGVYRNDGNGNYCYWERLSGLSGSLDDVITNGLPQGPVSVEIMESDTAFSTQ